MAVYFLLGNTTIKMSRRPGVTEVFPVRDADPSLAAALAPHRGEIAVAACVNPSCEPILQKACFAAGLKAPLYAGRDFPARLEMAVESPHTVGIDRILNVKAAYAKACRAAIVVDFGTAVSISACDSAGRFTGGAILPGLAMALKALADGTAVLPEIAAGRPKSALGANTGEAIRSGTYYGSLGAAKEIAARIQAILGDGAKVFATGGGSAIYGDDMPAEWVLAPGLTMDGLRLAYNESLK